MKTYIKASDDVKTALGEIRQHLNQNQKVVTGEKESDVLMIISREVYEVRLLLLQHNARCEFSFQCDPSCKTHLFQVK